MKKGTPLILILVLFANYTEAQKSKSGHYCGLFEYGNFSDNICFEVERDSINWKVFFTSLEQNASRIPLQDVEVNRNSIKFKLRSDFYTYDFKSRWMDDNSRLEGTLQVDSLSVNYSLTLEKSTDTRANENEDCSFDSVGININGTIRYPMSNNNKMGLVIVTSSGNQDRSSSNAEAILFAKKGYTTFHYDKRGTGLTEGDWRTSSVEELALDDINGIKYFSSKSGIPLANIIIKGSSQGGTKIPYILNQMQDLGYGIAVSCPGVTLLESDLNYWRNRNAEELGEDIDAAMALQGKVFEHIAGSLSRKDLEIAVDNAKMKGWFSKVWVPNLDEVSIDEKLLFSPVPYFEKVKQPMLVIQGSLDEIIPENSYTIISSALNKAKNTSFNIVLLDGGSHSMYNIGPSDFPYWSKLHPDYFKTIEDWIKNVSNKK